MKKSKGMQLGALLAAMLLLSIAFVAAAGAQGAYKQINGEKSRKIMTPDGHIFNESDFDKAIIESGTVKIPITSSVVESLNVTKKIAERLNVTKKVMDQLSVKVKEPDKEVLDVTCDYVAGECSYRIAKHVKAGTVTPPIQSYWAEDTYYHNSDSTSTTLFEALWNVPSAPINQSSPLPVIFYFPALVSYNGSADILQPVLEWGQVGRNYWDISSWYGIQQQYYHNLTLIRANVGDSIYGYVQKQTGQPTHWLIWTYEINTDQASSIYAYTGDTFDTNYVALETRNVDNSNRLSGGNDFTNLHLAGRTPSWTAEINQTLQAQVGTLGINIVSPSEVILKTGRMP